MKNRRYGDSCSRALTDNALKYKMFHKTRADLTISMLGNASDNFILFILKVQYFPLCGKE